MEVDEPTSCENSVVFTESDEDIFASSQEDDTLTDKHESATDDQIPECSKTETTNTPLSSETLDTAIPWRGTPLHKLIKNTGTVLYPPVVASHEHTVLFKLPVREGQVPEPWPVKPQDVWDQSHVRMPHSASNLYPVTPTELRSRWELVRQAFSTPITNSHQLETAILHYNTKYSDRWDFHVLHSFFSTALEEEESEYFFMKVLPKVVDLALSLPSLLTQGVPLLKQHVTHSISLTQQQISCLLANAFLCTFPRRNTGKRDSEYSTYPSINFNRLFTGDYAEAKGRLPSLHEKLKCFINYFRRVTTKVPDGVVTYSRYYVPPSKLPDWSKATCQLPNMYVSSTGTIEDEGTNLLQVDFANRFIGGGVLGNGCVQEEIRFVICPELIVARLFTEVMDDTEAVIITGCERFSTYSGYSNTFEWAGNVEDTTPRDSAGRRFCTIVAIDASRFPSAKTQYTAAHMSRELNKAYAGFSWGTKSGSCESVATGNWGCGAYRGDPNLKTLLQLIAAAVTGRELAYFTFGNTELRDRLAKMHSFLVKHQVPVGDLWKVIVSYNPALYRHSLYDHIYSTVTNGAVPTPFKGTNHPSFKKQRFLGSNWKNEGKTPVMKKEDSKETGFEKPDTKGNNNQRLSEQEIETALNSADNGEEYTEGKKPLEANTLNVKTNKELCIQRLNSSWTNLNDSKKDFGSSNIAVRSEEPSNDLNSSSTSSTRQHLVTNRKKKISDYFQSVSKS